MLRQAYRIVILIVGTTVLLIGVLLLVLPGPAFIVIPVGLAILATEYAWARRWLRIVRETTEKGAEKLKLRSVFAAFSRKSSPSEQSAARDP
jgi:tellurite resistance protein TerC